MLASDIHTYRENLIEIRERLRASLDQMYEAVPERINAPGELSSVPTHNADRDSEGVDAVVRLVHNEEHILGAVDEALTRIDAGTFGKCVRCGSDIAAARLQAIPYTPYCIGCAQATERV